MEREINNYSRYRLVRYRIRREIGYNAICLYVCVSVENRVGYLSLRKLPFLDKFTDEDGYVVFNII